MAEDSTSLLRKHNIALDRSIKGVMPSSWEGHARLIIQESDVIPEHIEPKAIDKALKLSKEKDKAPAKAASDLIAAVDNQE